MVVLPFPDPKLMPNRKNGQHWAVTNKIKNKAINDAYYITKSSDLISVENGLQITFYAPTNHRRDNDNLLAAMKPYLDGFAKALGIDDTNFNPLVIKRVDGVGKKNARVEIEGL
ncbi:hypothetical protein WMO13_06640 [Ignatzschineria larvae DSM 13226]|uniref:Uncharacterized protein n=1 Tax=Ignatzschineria larvae DSM 13226 TaxID=1111732 RepID=A0ABZ3BX16_9GAMM|nr:hypothetical protein [Ignatzschineria larvae]